MGRTGGGPVVALAALVSVFALIAGLLLGVVVSVAVFRFPVALPAAGEAVPPVTKTSDLAATKPAEPGTVEFKPDPARKGRWVMEIK